MRVAGIMSGTSLDGIDVAVVDVKRSRIEAVAFSTFPYHADLRARILSVSNASCTTAEISRLNFELGEVYAGAVRKACRAARVPLDSVQLIGCHGQTIYHEGGGRPANTLQIGEAAVIAERLGIPVVSNFRARDIAARGQGAPLVPFADFLLFRSERVHRGALNIGGIANVTMLPRGATAEEVIAFDTGPGNMVVDQLVARMTDGRERFDRGGEIAARGRVSAELLGALLRDPYFARKPPKSTGREQYGEAFVGKLIASGRDFADLIATATAFTAASIAAGVSRFAPATEELIVSGGGVHNRQLMGQIAAFLQPVLPGCRSLTSQDFGVDVDAKEAIAFAVLAWRTWRGKTGNLPGATGARRAVVLGATVPA